jgi:type I restriction enzyme S subunit
MISQRDSFLDALPAGWKSDRLKDVVSLRNEKTDEASAERDYLELEDIESGTGRILNRRDTLTVESAVTIFRKGDVLFGKLRPYLEKYYEAEFDGKCTGEILAFRPERLTSRFLFYCLGSRWFIERTNALAYGAKMPRVSWEKQLSQFDFPLPLLPEQRRIAAYLDASCTAIDASVEAKRRQLETLDTLRTSIICRAVTQGLNPSARMRASGVSWFGEIPHHWQAGHLKRYARRIQTGGTPPTDTPEYYEDGTIPWFAPGSFETQIELTEPRKLINRRALNEGVLRMFPAGSVFVIGIGATIGKVGVISEEASCNQQIIGIVCDHRMTPRFLAYQLKIYEVVIPGICVATTLPIFNQVQVGYLPVIVPPVSEQRAICDHIDSKLEELKEVVGVLEAQIDALIGYRKSLIHECVTGQRRVAEADVDRVKAHG